MAFKVITHGKKWRYFSVKIRLQYTILSFLSVGFFSGLIRTNLDLVNFSFGHTMRTKPNYNNKKKN